MKKIVFICNSSLSVLVFRLPLIKELEKNGYIVEVIAFDKINEESIKKENIKCHYIIDDGRSINPFKSLLLKNRIENVILSIKPDVVFTFMAKPNTFGVQAAHKATIKNIYSMVEGVGDPFINKSFKWKLIKFVECYLYKKSFKFSKTVFFLNNDDANEFIGMKLVKKNQAKIINGIGLDLDKFAFLPVNPESNTFIMVSRLLVTKGVYEYCKCAEIVKKNHPEAEFLLVGGEGTIKASDIRDYINNGSVNYIGGVGDVKPYLYKSLMLILPSYREGKPMSVMEAEAVGRGVIVSNRIGCKDMIIQNYNGFMVDQQDYSAMADICCKVLDNKDIAVQYGKNARAFAEKYFDQRIINKIIIDEIEKS